MSLFYFQMSTLCKKPHKPLPNTFVFIWNNSHLLCSVELFICLRLPSESMCVCFNSLTEAKFQVAPPWDRGKDEKFIEMI